MRSAREPRAGQLELRDGEPGPVPGRDAGFWLRGAGPRALINPRIAAAGRVEGGVGQDAPSGQLD